MLIGYPKCSWIFCLVDYHFFLLNKKRLHLNLNLETMLIKTMLSKEILYNYKYSHTPVAILSRLIPIFKKIYYMYNLHDKKNVFHLTKYNLRIFCVTCRFAMLLLKQLAIVRKRKWLLPFICFLFFSFPNSRHSKFCRIDYSCHP